MKIVADDKIPFLKGVFEPFAKVVYFPGNQINNFLLKDAEALIIRSITLCNAKLLENTPVKLIATATIGDDHIDKQFCKEKGIKWISAKGCNANAVSQYVAAAILELATNAKFELKGKTLGVIGVGNIGSKIGKVAGLFGMEVLHNDPPRERIEGSIGFFSLQYIQQHADIITLHVPLTYGGKDKTFHLLDEEFFEDRTKPVVLINTSRGGVLDAEVINWAKTEGRITNLILDVWENEPDIDLELLDMTDISTPHIAGYSLEGKANGTAIVVNAVSDFFDLGINGWHPDLPIEVQKIKLHCENLTEQEIFQNVFELVYPIAEDSKKLKSNAVHFEELRRNYIFRRENNNFILDLKNCQPEVKDKLSSIGFQIDKM